MAKKQATAWVLVHCEYMGTGPCIYVDSLVSHVSSSRRRAEAYVRDVHVDPYSWWELREFVVDCKDHDRDGAAHVEEVLFYSHRGTPLRRAPFKRARTAYDRELRRREQQPPAG
jgi:hypothetical protein